MIPSAFTSTRQRQDCAFSSCAAKPRTAGRSCTKRFLSLFAGLSGFGLLPAHASAQGVGSDIINVGSGLMPSFGLGGTGAGLFNSIVIFLSTRLMLLAGVAATFIIVKAGLSLINSQADDKLQKARRQIGTAVVAVMLGFLSERFVAATYGPPAGAPGTAIFNPSTSVGILEGEAAGVISFALEFIVILSVIIIIYTGIKVVASFGTEDGPAQLRKSVFGIVTGLVLLTSATAIQLTLGLNPSGPELATGPVTAGPIINRGIFIVQTMLGFMALVAVIVVIYSGIRLIVNVGNEEEYTKTKQLIGRVLVGLFIILMSYVFTLFIVQVLNG
jgi:hypothetical protein